MRKIGYPAYVDTLGLSEDKATREYYLKHVSRSLDLEDAAYLLVELQRRLGHWGSDDTTSFDYRIRQIETVLGITSPEMPVETPTVFPIYFNQWQAGRFVLVGATTIDVSLTYPVADIQDYYVRGRFGLENIEVGMTVTTNGIHFEVPEGLDYAEVEWAVQGSLGEETYVRTIEGSIATVVAGTVMSMSPSWANVNDYVVMVVATDDGSGGEVEVRAEKNTGSVNWYPAIDATVTYKIIGTTQ